MWVINHTFQQVTEHLLTTLAFHFFTVLRNSSGPFANMEENLNLKQGKGQLCFESVKYSALEILDFWILDVLM